MRERRKHRRHHVFFYLNIFDCDTGQRFGNLVDYSRGGIKIISKEKFKTDITRQLRLMLPETSFGEDWVEFEARTVWCARDINPEYFAAGLKFEKIDRDDEIILHRALEEYLFEK